MCASSLVKVTWLIVHVLSVSSLKGGVGKTTVTLGLASAAFSKGVRTLVVDLDGELHLLFRKAPTAIDVRKSA